MEGGRRWTKPQPCVDWHIQPRDMQVSGGVCTHRIALHCQTNQNRYIGYYNCAETIVVRNIMLYWDSHVIVTFKFDETHRLALALI